MNRIKRAHLAWVSVIVACLFLTGCTVDDLSPVPPPADGEASVILTVSTPQPTLPATFSRRSIETENRISAVTVLVFEHTNDHYIYSYYTTGTEITATSDFQTRFKVLLNGTQNPSKFILLTNAHDAFLSSAPSPGTTEEDVRKQLIENFPVNGWIGDLPMYGEIQLPDGTSSLQGKELPITLLRSIARVDVVKNLSEGSAEFDFREVYIFRANNELQLIPGELSSVSPPKVSSPSVPGTSGLLSSSVKYLVPEDDSQSVTRIYIPEGAAALNSDEQLAGTTTIVVGGRFNGASEITYYRADFNSGADGHPFGQILRNHRYIFSIRKVMSSGWNTPEEAANNLPVSMEVDIQNWEDFATELYFGEHRFGISSRNISLRYIKNRERRLDVESTLTYSIQWLDDNGQPTGSATFARDVTISNDHFDVTIVQEAGDADKISHLVFRTRNHNYNGDIKESKLQITVGKWSIEVNVSQDNTAMYSDRFFHVLSVDEVGNLGALLTTSAQAESMRAVLDYQFIPTGVIQIGGFAFTRIPNGSTSVGTTGTNLEVMKRIIGAQDVIYFNYNVSVSDEISQVLLDWLEASPKRVLMVGTDSKDTNAKLRNRLTDDGIWINGDIATVSPSGTYGFLRAPHKEGAEDFFSGPFGEVSAGAYFKRVDDIAGYNTKYPENIIPLINGSKTGYTDAMIFGVNKERRIIYNGDASLLYGSMSNTSGAINSDLDRLMGNVWSWIVEQNIYGDE